MMGRYAERGGLVSQGISAEMIADQWDLSREDLDAFGARSQQRRGPSHRRRALRARAHRGQGPRRRGQRHRRDPHHRRRHPPRHHRRGARQLEARLQARRQGDRRQLVADQRRRLGRAHHERGESGCARTHAQGAIPRLCPGGRGPRDDAHGTDPGHAFGAREGQDVDRATSTWSRSTKRSPRWSLRGRRSFTPTWPR